MSKEGCSLEKSNTHALDTFPTPKTQKQVRQFLALTGFYRNFSKTQESHILFLNY